ncbi:hypothetical protein N7512_003595 [Penicillium capsulatum]|nr:hypothetical protein N7512_003595 [Penicillium capsulatum]
MRLSLVFPCVFSLAAASSLKTTARATRTPALPPVAERAVRPTATGMIGIDPWQGDNSEQIHEVQTTTDDGKTATNTLSAPVAFMTGSNDEMSLVMTPDLRTELVRIAEGVTPCISKKRDPATCGVPDFARRVQTSESDLVREVLRMTESGSEGIQNLIDLLGLGGEAQLLESLGYAAWGVALLVFFYKAFSADHGNMPLAASVGSGTGWPNDPGKTPDDSSGGNGGDGDVKICPQNAPTGNERPICQECGGSSKSQTCTKGKWRNCDCLMAAMGISVQQPRSWGVRITVVFDDAISSGDQLLDSQKPDVNCSSNYADALSVEKTYLLRLARIFCSGDKNEAVLTDTHLQLNQQLNTNVAFKREPGEGCQATCDQDFEALFNQCEGINSHTAQAKGNATVKECKASYQYEVHKSTQPNCDVGKTSTVPANVFSNAPAWKTFCEDKDNDQKPRSIIYDLKGNKKTGRKRDDLQARTPPPNMDGYIDKLAVFSWEPNKQGLLSRNCSDAFHDIVQSECGRTGSQQNLMAGKGSVFVGSGTYSYRIINDNAVVPRWGTKTYHWKPDRFKDANKASDALKAESIYYACSLWDDVRFTPEDNKRDVGNSWSSSKYTYNVFWKKNCKLEEGKQEQSMKWPVEDDKSITCSIAFQNAAKIRRSPTPDQDLMAHSNWNS